jgi:DNA repair protein RadC
MVMRYAIDTGAHTPSDNGHSGTAAPGLWSGGGNLGLSDADCFDCRHIPSSTTSSAVRGRQILERLFTVAKIDNASAVASALIAEFGSIGAVLYSDSRPAKSNPAQAILSLVREAMLVSSKDKMLDRICLSKADDVIEYLIVAMARLPIEEVRVLFLDSKNRLICDEVVSRGTISEAPIYPREILKRALAVDAAALILAHNHPSGDPDPSEGDIEATRRLLKAAKELGLTVHDHIIVGSEGWISLRDWVSFQ